jgi:gas vesicle protein
MTNENQESEPRTSLLGVLAGMLIGALAGAVTMLLLAPQSGKRTRKQLQDKGIELRDRTTEMVEDVMDQVRLDRKKLAMGSRRKARELLHQGQDLVAEQLEHVSEAVLAGKKVIQNA